MRRLRLEWTVAVYQNPFVVEHWPKAAMLPFSVSETQKIETAHERPASVVPAIVSCPATFRRIGAPVQTWNQEMDICFENQGNIGATSYNLREEKQAPSAF